MEQEIQRDSRPTVEPGQWYKGVWIPDYKWWYMKRWYEAGVHDCWLKYKDHPDAERLAAIEP